MRVSPVRHHAGDRHAPFLADFLGNCAIAFAICPLMRQKSAIRYFGPALRFPGMLCSRSQRVEVPMGTLLGLCLACSIGLYAVDAAAQSRGDHDTFHEWYRGLRSPEGEGCCNERDCQPVASRYTPDGPEGAFVLEILIRNRWGQSSQGPDPPAIIPRRRRACLL